MEIVIVRDADEVGRVAALKIASVVQRDPEAVLGLATGSSPTGIYASLAARVAAGELDFGRASGFALDEYVGIPLEHPESYASVIERDVVVPLGMDASKVHVPDGRASDVEAAVVEYERAIADAGGIDIQILGIGANGHIGFNEPTSSFASRTRIKTLAPQTRADNARFFDDPSQVPTHCLTQGLGTILDAHEVVLVAQGSSKASAVAGMVEGPLGAMCPGSALQLHRHATIVVDEAAASLLQLADYYRYTYANKPVWQRFE
ncbi:MULTISPECIES: glucosamine-6-phosphate deaminase [Frigoribacterium]|jgi:glucosamine-6-phosphate deaminase|uniref:glucosamine-6-phosphate deaminase n=1 Tax=Frigoribacterium TaxID=96492 RepID=UPI0006F7B472|nr:MULTISPECIES: glucosamine-6-phosphate deaminase [Frigoribacterium]KQM29287.1 glucosamine-6-phosphate deaminase [Frigoribacterium sp. Leaf8]MBD8484704.1 glucosamine-6-phosphate deaminase [Frigoribacterium sp. CFBP 8759]NQW88008.1 glucosamine-6-phosphate deaminase [Frigoribacterium sp. VKM Ac-2860]NQX09183.1 glucosamine-6-phosphate deaminase [Frigoribacterium sp. VKM Ac-2859]VXB80954.1 Glucosamine-6-phosphate deaminase [Frigoribacterium sp. 9N]